MKYLVNLDLNKKELQNARIQPLGSDPSSPVEGQIYHNSTAHKLKIHNGTAFQTIYDASNTLDTITIAAADVNLNTHKITNLAAGTAASNDAARMNDIQISSTGGLQSSSGVWSVKLNDASLTSGASGLSTTFAGTGSAASSARSDHDHNTIYLALSGGTLTGALILAADPSSAFHAATKQYVDNSVVGLLDFKNSVHYATTSALPACTYNNGSSGVGATLTGSSNGALANLDGTHSLATNDRVLVKNQAAALQNGIYVVTQVGSGALPFILTRSTDADNSPTNEVTAGLYTFVELGTTNNSTGWVLATTSNADGKTVVIGTDSATFTQFSGAGTVTGGTGIAQSGNNLYISSTTLNAAADTLDLASIVTAASSALYKVAVDVYGRVTSTTAATISDVGGLGTGIATFLGTPSSANLLAAVTDETGTGSLVFATSPSLTTPTLGVATATTINKVAITAPATSATLTIANGKTLTANSSLTLAGVDAKTLTVNNTVTLSGTDGSTITFGAGGTVLYNGGVLGTPSSGTLTFCTGLPISTGVSGLGTGIATWLATPSSANLLAAITDETGTGALVFGTSPTITTSLIAGSASFDLINTIATTVNFARASTTLSIGAASGTTTINNALTVTGTLTAPGITKKYSAAIGDGASTTITVTHNLNTQDIHVTIYDATTFEVYVADVNNATVNTCSVTFAVAPTTNQYRVVVIG